MYVCVLCVYTYLSVCVSSPVYEYLYNGKGVSTKPLFLTYKHQTGDFRTYVRKMGLVDIGFLLTGQWTRLGPARPTDAVDCGRQHPSEKTYRSPGTNWFSGHNPWAYNLSCKHQRRCMFLGQQSRL